MQNSEFRVKAKQGDGGAMAAGNDRDEKIFG